MLLGRERERQTLARLLEDARESRSGVLALVGDAGIGKSALLDHAATLAIGMNVLRTRSVESEAQIPFAGLFDLLRPALSCLDRIPAPQASALESALALRPARSEGRFAVGAATLSLLAAHAETAPLAVLVDDVHWLDGSSAAALLFAVRRLLAEPIAVILTAREEEPSLLDTADLPVLRVEGLDADDAELLLRREAPVLDAGTAGRLHLETGGNPLALLELARAGLPSLTPAAPLPVSASIAANYLQRAAALPARTGDALVLAAATDRGELGLFTRAAATLGLEVADLAPAETEALVALDGARLEFRHPLARSAIYGAAPAERRREIHRAIARALGDIDADRRAWHLALAAAGPDGTASSALEQAGERAYGRNAYDVASQAFERAGNLSPAEPRRAELLAAAADAAWLGGLGDRAIALLDEAERIEGDGVPAAEIQRLRGHIALWRGPLAEGRAVLLAAAGAAAAAEAVVMLAEAAMGAFYAAETAEIRECAARVSELAAADGTSRSSFFAAIVDGMALVLSGEGERGAASIREAVRVLEASDELRSDPRLLVWAAMGPLWLREAGAGLALVDSALAAARAESAVGVLPHLLAHVAIQHAATNRWAEAEAGFDESIRLARESGQRVVLAAALARLALLESRLGRAAASRAHADEALAIAREQGIVLCEIWALGARAELELGLGNADAALAAVEEQKEVLDRQRIADVDLFPGPEHVELALRLGRREEAVAAADAFQRAAEAKGQPWALARAARGRALLAADHDFDEAFEEARALHARTPDGFEAARTELAHGARLRRAGRRVDARERLRIAIDVFDGLGAVLWAELARTELAATGETPRRREAASRDELTPQELQISLLLAEGRTTREAAAALFLSPKTIEYHLRNAYRKLAIHSREELREALRPT